MQLTLRNSRIFLKREYLRGFTIVLIFVFALLPLITIAFNINFEDLKYVLNDNVFYQALLNSLMYSFIASLLTTILALITAYFLNNASIKGKNLLVVLLTLGMLVPTLSIGLGVRVLFGVNGFLDKITGVKIEAIGMFGLILGSIITAFPSSFLIIYDALKYEDKSPYDAANIMGISKLSSFIRVTLPYLKIAIISSFFASFTLIFSDYGIPMELAGKVKTLPMYLYEQFMSLFKYGRGSIAAIFLLGPALLSFGFDLFFKENSNTEKNKNLIQSTKYFNVITIVIIILISILLFLPQLSFIALTFIKAFPNDMTFTLEHVKSIFVNKYGRGILTYLLNSIIIAVFTGILGTCFAYLLGYFAVRKAGKLSKMVNMFAISTIAIPGIVLGIGFMYLFRGTYKLFYGTMLILIVVNIFHFLGSPYLLAKNSLAKINKDYEIIGDTLGISKIKIIFKVLIPNSITTIIEMFSYFLLNSMITISAVSFLSTYRTQPLAILITNFEKSGNYEMQGVISLLILAVNVCFRSILNGISSIIKRKQRRLGNEFMELTRYQFELLTYLEKNGKNHYSERHLSDILTISMNTVNKVLKELFELNYIELDSSGQLSITEKGLLSLEPYRVRKAIIFAAGFGSRMAPVTLDTPKPLVKVNGVRIIDTLLDALIGKGITNIVIVRGYKKEKFDELLEKYPFIKFVDNELFNVTNNISSAIKAIDFIDRCYICEADLLISNPEIIRKYEFTTNYLGAKVSETDDWCFKKVNGYIEEYGQGGEDCYQAYGISYWNESDSIKLRNDLVKLYNSRAGHEYFWEAAALRIYKKNYKIEIRKCHKQDIIEIDNFSELVMIDSSYADYPGHENY